MLLTAHSRSSGVIAMHDQIYVEATVTRLEVIKAQDGMPASVTMGLQPSIPPRQNGCSHRG